MPLAAPRGGRAAVFLDWESYLQAKQQFSELLASFANEFRNIPIDEMLHDFVMRPELEHGNYISYKVKTSLEQTVRPEPSGPLRRSRALEVGLCQAIYCSACGQDLDR